MKHHLEEDYAFLSKTTLCLSGSLDLSQAMRDVFAFLKQHFPLAALSLHRFDPHLKALHLLFLVTENGFYYLDEIAPLPENMLDEMTREMQRLRVFNIPVAIHKEPTRPSDIHGKAISAYLPLKERAYLVGLLSSRDKTAGHLCLIGTNPYCFTEEHERKFRMLVPIFSLVMLNLLQHQDLTELKERLAEQNRLLTGEIRCLREVEMVGADTGLSRLIDRLGQLSGRDVPVLIYGETGTGKEVIANAIQRISTRFDTPYIKVNCGAIPDTLIDSELFGHEKGAFTGAVAGRFGLFEKANGGTLFLDEVGDMPLQAQKRLLRVLQDGIITRVGGMRSIHVNVRIIAATHCDLPAMIKSGAFREDLYYRLRVFSLRVPPLRERREDIVLLIHYFIRKQARELHLSHTPTLAPESLSKLMSYDWPGNVRELENLVRHALIVENSEFLELDRFLPEASESAFPESDKDEKNRNHPSQLFERVLSGPGESNANRARPMMDAVFLNRIKDMVSEAVDEKFRQGLPFFANPAKKDHREPQSERLSVEPIGTLNEVIAEHIRLALKRCGGKIQGPGGVAEVLGINPNTLRRRMDKLKIDYGRLKKR